jgi:hypothetical protein
MLQNFFMLGFAATSALGRGFVFGPYMISWWMIFSFLIIFKYLIHPVQLTSVFKTLIFIFLPLVASNFMSPLHGLHQISLLRMFLMISPIVLIFFQSKNNEDLLYWLSLGMIFMLPITLLDQLIDKPIFADGNSYRLRGANVIASAIIFSLPFYSLFFRYQFQLKSQYNLIILPVIVLISSRMLYIFLMCALLLSQKFSFKKFFKKNVLLFFFFLGMFIFVDSSRSLSDFERIHSTLSCLQFFLHYPLTGLGFGGWEFRYELIGIVKDNHMIILPNRHSALNPHNSAIRLLCDIGLFSFAYIWFISVKALNLISKYRNTDLKMFVYILLLSVFVKSMFSDAIEEPAFYILIMVIIILNVQPLNNLFTRINDK